MLRRIVGLAARRPVAVLAVTAVVTVLAAVLALRLEPSTGYSTLVGSGSASAKATQRYHERFGDDPIIVLVKEKLTDLTLTSDLARLVGLEGCLSGNVPAGVTPRGGPGGPCAKLGATKPVKVVIGPGTFVNVSASELSSELNRQTRAAKARSDRAAQAARQLAAAQGRTRAEADRLARQARQLVRAEFLRTLYAAALRYGLRSAPSIDDPQFVSRLVFDAAKPAGTPKERFAYLFPTPSSALIQVRLKPGLSDAQRSDALQLVRDAVAMPDWKLRRGGTFTVTGAPVVLQDLAGEVQSSIIVLLIAALLVMAATLALVFRARLRLLPLVVALAAAALTFGALSLAGATLTMASVAVLPVLIGLAVDYAIQWQSRVAEVRGDLDRAARFGAPTLVTAAAATIAGFLVLVLSPVPMVRGFGVLLVVGIVLALGLALIAGTAAIVLARRGHGPGVPEALAAAGRGARDLLGPPLATVGRAVSRTPAAHRARRTGAAAGAGVVGLAQRRPGRVLAAAAVLALAGWALDTQTRIESDVLKLVPRDLPALANLEDLQRSTGVGSNLDVVVEADDVADPTVISWMTAYQRRVLQRFGYSAKRGCGTAEVCPAFSLPDIFSSAPQSETAVRALLDTIPPYFSQSVVSPDRRTATLAFGIRLMPLDRQQRVIDDLRHELDPPPGVTARLAGLPVLAAEANERVSSDWRRLLQLVVGLLAVFVVLRLALRSTRRAAIPLVPIVLATGWSSLVLFCLRIPLNPMSVTLGALVIAISTEFSVLLSERYRQERAGGCAVADALRRTYRSTGAAVLASGVTAIAGFAVLVLSDIRMLRDFGFVTVVDLTVSLVGVLVVLPSVLVLAERGLKAPKRGFRPSVLASSDVRPTSPP